MTSGPLRGPGEGKLAGVGPYRIATVAEVTGVPEATLRAWERRYGIPTPERTASGYRLYGAAEVEQVREMRRLCEEDGLAAAEAARVVQARAVAITGGPSPANHLEAGIDPFQAVTEAVLDAVARFDDEALEQQLGRLFLMGSAGQIFERAIAPALVEIGERWHAGELTVAQEHFASHKIETLMRHLLRLSPGTQAEHCAVFASFADDEHELGLLGFALRVSEWGTRPIFLGARTPPSAVGNAVESLSPKLVGLSVSVAPPRPRARELVEGYAAACGDVPWIVGGAAAPRIEELVTKSGGLIAPQDTAGLRAIVQPILDGRRRR